jgi:uncharacterized protein YrzB (UPF0473 family)
MKIKISQLRNIIKEELSSQYLKADRNSLIEKILDIQLEIEGIEKNSPEWYERWGDIRDKINSALDIEWHDDINEGFLDKAKNLGRAGMVALGLSGTAHANPTSFSDYTMSSTDENENDDIIMLEDDEGVEHKFYWVIEVKLNGKRYAALELADGSEDEGKKFLFHYEEGPQGENFREIEDESEWEAVRQKVEEELGNGS